MKKIAVLTSSVIIGLLISGTALAATNPSGTGQPGAECGADNALMSPQGFSTEGFAKAEAVYAGSDGSASLAHSNSSKSISQYDVACYQLSQK